MIIIINNDKYDVTEFINEHPGGKDVFIDGADMTAEFNKIGHSKHAIQMLEKYKIQEYTQILSFKAHKSFSLIVSLLIDNLLV